MAAKVPNKSLDARVVGSALRGWGMAALTLVLILIYGAAVTGWFRPLPDEKVVARLEPMIFVVIGFYFGRLPSQQNESSLKDELSRLTQKADAAQHAKEQVQQARETLEEKMRNVRTILASSAPDAHLKSPFEHSDGDGIDAYALYYSATAALNILNS